MSHVFLSRVSVLLLTLALAGCGSGGPKREAWRADENDRCFAHGDVQISSYIQQRPPLEGAGLCGIDRPLTVYGLMRGTVEVEPKVTLDCSETATLDRFMAGVVQPAAMARFGQPAVAMLDFGAYSCRSRDNRPGGKISEHAFGNAIDVAGFRLADGRHVRVRTGWKGDADEAAFWRDVEAGACDYFRTVLGPGSDGYHEDHLHLDLLHHDLRGARHICDPRPVHIPPTALASHPLPGAGGPVTTASVRPQTRVEIARDADALNPFDPGRIEAARDPWRPAPPSPTRSASLPQALPPALPPALSNRADMPLYRPPELGGSGPLGGLY